MAQLNEARAVTGAALGKRQREPKATKPMREAMPEVTAWVDALRLAFGEEHVDGIIRQSLRDGTPSFYARENGNELGSRKTESGNVWAGDGLADRHFCTGCDGTCVGTVQRCTGR